MGASDRRYTKIQVNWRPIRQDEKTSNSHKFSEDQNKHALRIFRGTTQRKLLLQQIKGTRLKSCDRFRCHDEQRFFLGTDFSERGYKLTGSVGKACPSRSVAEKTYRRTYTPQLK